ncbi:hypothetical protein [Methylorubrum aminovorans]
MHNPAQAICFSGAEIEPGKQFISNERLPRRRPGAQRQACVEALSPLNQERRRVLGAERAQGSHHQIGVQTGQVAELPIAHDEHVVDAGGEAEGPGEKGGSVGRLIEQRRSVGARR